MFYWEIVGLAPSWFKEGNFVLLQVDLGGVWS